MQAQICATNLADYPRSEALSQAVARALRPQALGLSTRWFAPSSTRARLSNEGLPQTTQRPFLLSLITSQLAHSTACCRGIRFRGTNTRTAAAMCTLLRCPGKCNCPSTGIGPASPVTPWDIAGRTRTSDFQPCHGERSCSFFRKNPLAISLLERASPARYLT